MCFDWSTNVTDCGTSAKQLVFYITCCLRQMSFIISHKQANKNNNNYTLDVTNYCTQILDRCSFIEAQGISEPNIKWENLLFKSFYIKIVYISKASKLST